MKVKILKDDDIRISSGLWQTVKAGTERDLPKATAQTLIDKGSAEAIKPNPKTPAAKD